MAVTVKVELRTPFTLTDLVAFAESAKANNCPVDEPVVLEFTHTGNDHDATIDGHPWPIGFITLHAPTPKENQ